MKRSDVIWAGAAAAVLWLWWRSRPRRIAETTSGGVGDSTGTGASPAPLPADTPLIGEAAQQYASKPATVTGGNTTLTVQDVPTAEESPDETPITAETMSPLLRERQTVGDRDGLTLSEQLSNPFKLSTSTPIKLF